MDKNPYDDNTNPAPKRFSLERNWLPEETKDTKFVGLNRLGGSLGGGLSWTRVQGGLGLKNN